MGNSITLGVLDKHICCNMPALATSTRKRLGRITSLSRSYLIQERLGKIGLGLWLGSAIAVAILPSPKLGPIAKGYLTVYFVVLEYLVAFGTVIATLAGLVQQHRESRVSSASSWTKWFGTSWRVLFSPVVAALIFCLSGLLMYFPLILGHIAQLALYGEYSGETVYAPHSLIYPFNWPHFFMRGK
jgi:hypothetical protein